MVTRRMPELPLAKAMLFRFLQRLFAQISTWQVERPGWREEQLPRRQALIALSHAGQHNDSAELSFEAPIRFGWSSIGTTDWPPAWLLCYSAFR
jgi:hypothetical protein